MTNDFSTAVLRANENVDGIIHLLQQLVAAGVISNAQAAHHEMRIAVLRSELNAHCKEVLALRERTDEALDLSST